MECELDSGEKQRFIKNEFLRINIWIILMELGHKSFPEAISWPIASATSPRSHKNGSHMLHLWWMRFNLLFYCFFFRAPEFVWICLKSSLSRSSRKQTRSKFSFTFRQFIFSTLKSSSKRQCYTSCSPEWSIAWNLFAKRNRNIGSDGERKIQLKLTAEFFDSEKWVWFQYFLLRYRETELLFKLSCHLRK